MNPTSTQSERERIRLALKVRADQKRIGLVLDQQHRARQAERESLAAMRADGRITKLDLAARRQLVAHGAAIRRDQLARALDYPMTAEELRDACQHATLSAHVQGTRVKVRKITKGSDEYQDVSQTLMLDVMRRHGPNPPRVKVQAVWLRQRAAAIALDALRAHERATGSRAAAEQLADWHERDSRAAAADAAGGGDLVWSLAANRPMWDQAEEEQTAWRVADALPALTHLQRDAVRIALGHERQRGARPLPGKVRVAFHAATAILRKRFHTADAVRCAVRPDSYSALVLVEAAIRVERERAAVASRGG